MWSPLSSVGWNVGLVFPAPHPHAHSHMNIHALHTLHTRWAGAHLAAEGRAGPPGGRPADGLRPPAPTCACASSTPASTTPTHTHTHTHTNTPTHPHTHTHSLQHGRARDGLKRSCPRPDLAHRRRHRWCGEGKVTQKHTGSTLNLSCWTFIVLVGSTLHLPHQATECDGSHCGSARRAQSSRTVATAVGFAWGTFSRAF
jgi:hypothetical protein